MPHSMERQRARMDRSPLRKGKSLTENSQVALLTIKNMTQEEISRIKNSWRSLREVKPEIVGDVFYTKLFLESPELKPLFHGAMDQQSRKLINMLNVVVAR